MKTISCELDSNSLPGKYECQYEGCNKKYSRKHRLAFHVKCVHLHSIKQYRCSICTMQFLESGNLKIHLRIHTGEKPYQCLYCPKTFTTSGNKKDHERRHIGLKQFQYFHFNMIRPFVCRRCGKEFFRNSSLITHVRKCFNYQLGYNNQESDNKDLKRKRENEIICFNDDFVRSSSPTHHQNVQAASRNLMMGLPLHQNMFSCNNTFQDFPNISTNLNLPNPISNCNNFEISKNLFNQNICIPTRDNRIVEQAAVQEVLPTQGQQYSIENLQTQNLCSVISLPFSIKNDQVLQYNAEQTEGDLPLFTFQQVKLTDSKNQEKWQLQYGEGKSLLKNQILPKHNNFYANSDNIQKEEEREIINRVMDILYIRIVDNFNGFNQSQ